jgi:hypothetical protein
MVFHQVRARRPGITCPARFPLSKWLAGHWLAHNKDAPHTLIFQMFSSFHLWLDDDSDDMMIRLILQYMKIHNKALRDQIVNSSPMSVSIDEYMEKRKLNLNFRCISLEFSPNLLAKFHQHLFAASPYTVYFFVYMFSVANKHIFALNAEFFYTNYIASSFPYNTYNILCHVEDNITQENSKRLRKVITSYILSKYKSVKCYGYSAWSDYTHIDAPAIELICDTNVADNIIKDLTDLFYRVGTCFGFGQHAESKQVYIQTDPKNAYEIRIELIEPRKLAAHLTREYREEALIQTHEYGCQITCLAQSDPKKPFELADIIENLKERTLTALALDRPKFFSEDHELLFRVILQRIEGALSKRSLGFFISGEQIGETQLRMPRRYIDEGLEDYIHRDLRSIVCTYVGTLEYVADCLQSPSKISRSERAVSSAPSVAISSAPSAAAAPAIEVTALSAGTNELFIDEETSSVTLTSSSISSITCSGCLGTLCEYGLQIPYKPDMIHIRYGCFYHYLNKRYGMEFSQNYIDCYAAWFDLYDAAIRPFARRS